MALLFVLRTVAYLSLSLPLPVETYYSSEKIALSHSSSPTPRPARRFLFSYPPRLYSPDNNDNVLEKAPTPLSLSHLSIREDFLLLVSLSSRCLMRCIMRV